MSILCALSGLQETILFFFFQNVPLNHNYTSNSSLALAAEFWSNSFTDLTANHISNIALPVTSINVWQPPLSPWLKLNCDGSSLNYCMGVGGCLRNASGNWLLGFAKSFGVGGPLEVELKVILLGLEIVTSLPQIPKTMIETDSSEALQLLLDSSFHSHATVIENCRYLLTKLGDYHFVKVSRQQNSSANTLAKEGR